MHEEEKSSRITHSGIAHAHVPYLLAECGFSILFNTTAEQSQLDKFIFTNLFDLLSNLGFQVSDSARQLSHNLICRFYEPSLEILRHAHLNSWKIF
jgi:hypothetical protein